MAIDVYVKAKNIFMSKMFWLGALQIAIGVSELIINYLNNPELGVASVISGAVTIILRYLTKQPVSVTGKDVKLVEGPGHGY